MMKLQMFHCLTITGFALFIQPEVKLGMHFGF